MFALSRQVLSRNHMNTANWPTPGGFIAHRELVKHRTGLISEVMGSNPVEETRIFQVSKRHDSADNCLNCQRLLPFVYHPHFKYINLFLSKSISYKARFTLQKIFWHGSGEIGTGPMQKNRFGSDKICSVNNLSVPNFIRAEPKFLPARGPSAR